MLARLQRWVLAAVALVATAWVALCAWWREPGWAVLGVALLGAGHTAVLGLEFVLAAFVHGEDPAPRAGPWTLFKAWLEECRLSWRVFCWQQPFRARRWADVPGRPGVRGVVLVHGYVCNRGFWNPWLARWHRQQRPCVAVNLEPVFGSLEAYVPQVEQAVARLERETGLAPVIVGHSMGGLVARAWLSAASERHARAHRLITIGTPHQGTWLARWSSTENSRLMRPGSAWLETLAAREQRVFGAAPSPLFTCFYSHADNIVMPPSTATLQGADNRHLSGAAHVAMADRRDVFYEVERWLNRPSTPAAPVTADADERARSFD